MKFLKKSIYALSLVSMMGLWSCSQEEMLQDGGVQAPSGKPVQLTLTVNRGDALTRTSLSENDEAGLTSVWDEEDVLHVYNNNGVEVGTLDLIEIVSPSVGVFSGEVTAADGEYNVWYYPANNDNLTTTTDKDGKTKIAVDLTTQKFTNVADFAKLEILSKKITLKVNANVATVTKDETMKSRMAFARFSLTGIEGKKGSLEMYNGVVYNSDGEVTDYDKTFYKVTFDCGYPNSQPAFVSDKEYRLKFPNVEGGKDVFAAFTPDKDFTLVFDFTAEDGSKYHYSFSDATKLEAGKYYNNGLGTDGKVKGAEIPMVKDDSGNPGNTNNWSGEDTKIVYDGTLKRVSDADGWTTNIRNVYKYGGWATLYTYKQNAIVDGLLSSTDDGGAFYYQWGRWLGFPSACVNTYWSNEEVWGSYPTSAQNLPGNPHNNFKVGYLGDDSLMVTYCSGYMGANSNFTRQKAINWSIMFAMVSKAFVGNCDYIYANEECKWEARSGNPCPDTYRLPTASELQALIPSIQTINKSYSEFKEVDGIRYAMKWTKGYADTNYVEIQSIRSDEKDIDKVDFSGVAPIRLSAYGYIDSRCNSGYKAQKLAVGTLGMYWSNESGKNTMSGTEGNGAKYLSVIFDGDNVNFSIRVAPRTFGGCVIPIKDSSAKSSSVTPWLPYCGQY